MRKFIFNLLVCLLLSSVSDAASDNDIHFCAPVDLEKLGAISSISTCCEGTFGFWRTAHRANDLLRIRPAAVQARSG